jgi:hypothetical protein
MTDTVTVIQSDRDAAASFMRQAWHLFWPGAYEIANEQAKDVGAGNCDNWHLVQFVAKVRIAAEQAQMERVEEVAEYLIEQRDELWPLGTESDRLHYWRDKAIEAARRLRSLRSGG